MVRIPELGLDDSTPAGQWARASAREMNLAEQSTDHHDFARLPSYEGYAGHCTCGTWEPDGAFDHFGDLTAAFMRHLEDDVFPAADEDVLRKEAEFYRLGDLIGYQRVIERDDEHGIRHTGWTVAGQRGSVNVPAQGTPSFKGTWRAFVARPATADAARPQS